MKGHVEQGQPFRSHRQLASDVPELSWHTTFQCIINGKNRASIHQLCYIPLRQNLSLRTHGTALRTIQWKEYICLSWTSISLVFNPPENIFAPQDALLSNGLNHETENSGDNAINNINIVTHSIGSSISTQYIDHLYPEYRKTVMCSLCKTEFKIWPLFLWLKKRPAQVLSDLETVKRPQVSKSGLVRWQLRIRIRMAWKDREITETTQSKEISIMVSIRQNAIHIRLAPARALRRPLPNC